MPPNAGSGPSPMDEGGGPLKEPPRKGRDAPKPSWTTIGGRAVDLGGFKHPGGNIIDLFQGIDATSAFEVFHGHSTTAQQMLRARPTKELAVAPAKDDRTPTQPKGHAEWMTMIQRKWRDEGLYEPRPWASGMCVVSAALVQKVRAMPCSLCGMLPVDLAPS